MEIMQLRVSDIVPTKDNKRKIDVKEESFMELVDSIKAGGVRVPVHVRPIEGGKYELRAGQRRWTACRQLKIETIPAVVHEKMEDSDAMDLTYTENKFRENLKPMEEVEEIALLMERFGCNIKLVADRIGKSEGWVRVRANIYKSLSKEWRQAILKPDKDPDSEIDKITISHLEIIARLPERFQHELFDDIIENWADYSVNELKEVITREMRLLSDVKWNLDDLTLVPSAGCCSACEKRTGCQPLLWYDFDDQVEAGDQCLDMECFNAKSMAYIERQAKDLREKYPNLVYCVSDYPMSDEAKLLHDQFGSYLQDYEFKNAAKKTDKDAVPAMVIHGKGVGTIRYIKIDKELTSGKQSRIRGTPTPLKERRAALDCKRWAQVLVEMRKIVEATEVTGLSCIDKPEKTSSTLMSLAAAYGISINWDDKVKKHSDVQKIINEGAASAWEYIWNRLQRTLDCLLVYNGPITQTPKEYIENAKWIAELVCADLAAIFNSVSQQKGFTEPASWKSLNADGTPKTAKVKNKKAS